MGYEPARIVARLFCSIIYVLRVDWSFLLFGRFCGHLSKLTVAINYTFRQTKGERNDDDLIDPFFKGITSTYDGPVALSQDLMVFNVTPEQIVLRMAKTEQLWWSPRDPEAKGGDTLERGYTSAARTPDWVVATKIR